MPAGVSFNRDISLGNILSAATVLVTATIFILSIRNSSQLEMTELRGEMKVYSASLEQLKHDFADFKTTSQASNAEARQSLSQLTSALADMRVLIAGIKDGRR